MISTSPVSRSEPVLAGGKLEDQRVDPRVLAASSGVRGQAPAVRAAGPWHSPGWETAFFEGLHDRVGDLAADLCLARHLVGSWVGGVGPHNAGCSWSIWLDADGDGLVPVVDTGPRKSMQAFSSGRASQWFRRSPKAIRQIGPCRPLPIDKISRPRMGLGAYRPAFPDRPRSPEH